MQVSHAQPSDNYAIVGGGKSRDFQIASSAHAFKILSDALYRDKEGAVVRETICNAKDAHIASGKPNHPIRITLTDTEFTIEDDGTGIPDEKMVEVYLTYFGSTKTNDDSQIGGFGLGCKAPFCLTDHFMVTSRCNHVQSTYALTAGNDDTDGKPSIQLMASMPTTMSGLKVSIPIDRDKKSTFYSAIIRVLRDGGIQATLNGLMVAGNSGVEIDLDGYTIAKQLEAAIGNPNIKVTEDEAGVLKIETNGRVAIKDASALQQHIERAVAGEGAKGFANFLKKFAEIKRQHTADELLVFLKQADMPFSDDGSILAYKVLVVEGDHMVDQHSKLVKQKLGSLVFMPDSKVDDNRRVACSTGLHIAARSYLGSYWGGGSHHRVCIVKIQPKDVIAVPYGQSKMRVSAYHIIKVLGQEDAKEIASGHGDIFKLPSSHKALEEAVGGDHTAILETVEVTGMGQIKVTPIAASKTERTKKKRIGKVSATHNKRGEVVKVHPANVNILKKLMKHSDLSKFEPKHVKKLVQAQKMLDKGDSLRTIAGATGLDRDSLGIRLVRKAA